MAVLNEKNEVINIVVYGDNVEENELLKIYTLDNPACIGGDYFEGYFYPPKKYNSWLRDTVNKTWIPPNPRPNDGKYYVWNESKLEWQES